MLIVWRPWNPMISPIQPVKCVFFNPDIKPRSPIQQQSEPLMLPAVKVISFLPLDQQLLKFSPLLDHVTEMICHLFKQVQFDFEEGNFKSSFGIELLPSFALAR